MERLYKKLESYGQSDYYPFHMPGHKRNKASSAGEFPFDIDHEWKRKLVEGLDDIGITLQYEDLIAAYEKQRPSYWQ